MLGNLGLVFFIFLFVCPSIATGLFWQQLKSEHFIVNYTADKIFAAEVLNKAESYYNKISANLGYAKYSDFWTWTKRAQIFIYPDHQSYLEGTGQMDWSDGKADYKNKQISMYAGDPKFLDAILPHEMAHLIFRDFIGFSGNVPLWLDEGIATLAEEQTYDNIKKNIKNYYDRSALLTLKDMMTLDFKNCTHRTTMHDIIMKNDRRGILSMSPTNFLALFYIEATSVVGFLKERFGDDRFTEFCRTLRDGKTIDQALEKAYPTECPNLIELEKKWRQYVAE